jgi:hypothetical protein
MSKKLFGVLVFAMAFVVALGGAPAYAEETSLTALETPGCDNPGLDLAALTGGADAVCPLAPAEETAPEFLAAPPTIPRYCVCSCGAPCKTDAQCGPGGRCRPGITCC